MLPRTCDLMFRSIGLSLWQRSRFSCTPINDALISNSENIFRFIHTTCQSTDNAVKERCSVNSLDNMLDMCEQILSTKDKKIEEYAFHNAVKTFCTRYSTLLDTEQKLDLFQGLCARFSVTGEKLESMERDIAEFMLFRQEEGWRDTSNPRHRLHMLKCFKKIHSASEPAYSDLLDAITQSPKGVTFLVKLSGDLIECREMIHQRNPSKELRAELKALSETIRQKLVVLFRNSSLLRLERVSWDTSPASMMEQLGTEEKVHKLRNWAALKNRLASNKRVYVWTHPSLPGRPLVALYTSLLHEIPTRMKDVLSERRTIAEPTVAAFYSISNLEPGLSGVELGQNLIKEVVKDLVNAFPSVKTFVTLSPLPHFSGWLKTHLQSGTNKPKDMTSIFKDGEMVAVKSILNIESNTLDEIRLLKMALDRLCEQSNPIQEELYPSLEGPLKRLAARYLIMEKHKGKAFDPVAHFHVQNGAEIYDIHFESDTTRAGMARSFGIMVNYLYSLEDIENNRRNYIADRNIKINEKLLHLL